MRAFLFSLVVFFALSAAGAGRAQPQIHPLPGPKELISRYNIPAIQLRVVEPHLSTPERSVEITYIGFDATAVFDALLGNQWRTFDGDIEFRALDGYLSQIEVSRFKMHRSVLAYAIQGKSRFAVDNPGQNQKDVPLGPYYLVWDNRGQDELLRAGATDWPYQVNLIGLSNIRQTALLPGGLAMRFAQEAKLVQKHCLTCHQISGFGGSKWPGDLARSTNAFDEKAFAQWVLNPSALKPGTAMPALLPGRPLSERQDIAIRVFGYLKARADYGSIDRGK